MKNKITQTQITDMARAIKKESEIDCTVSLLIHKDGGWEIKLNTGVKYEFKELLHQIDFDGRRELPDLKLYNIKEEIYNLLNENNPEMLYKKTKWTYEKVVATITGE